MYKIIVQDIYPQSGIQTFPDKTFFFLDAIKETIIFKNGGINNQLIIIDVLFNIVSAFLWNDKLGK